MPTTPLLLVLNYALGFEITTKYKEGIRELYSLRQVNYGANRVL
jgi:hypothetical protein